MHIDKIHATMSRHIDKIHATMSRHMETPKTMQKHVKKRMF